MPQLRVEAAIVVFDPGLSLATTPGVGAGLAPSSPKAFITSFTWRGSASIQSPRELHRTVLLRIWSCLLRSTASPIICVLISYLSLNFWISHSASSLEALTVTSSPWTEALIIGTCSLAPAQANLLQEAPKLAFPVLSSVTGAVQALSQQPTLPTAWSSSVSFGKLDVDPAPRLRIEVRSSHVNHQEHCLLLVA